MILKRAATAGTIALLLTTCTSCRTESLDADGDGVVTKTELVSALVDHICGTDSGSDDSDNTTNAESDGTGEDTATTGEELSGP